MLVLTRKPDEKIIIRTPGVTDIVVTLVQIRPKAVRIGIDAGSETCIVRKEIDGKESNQAA